MSGERRNKKKGEGNKGKEESEGIERGKGKRDSSRGEGREGGRERERGGKFGGKVDQTLGAQKYW
jgi:hypothetical protein